MPDDKLDDKPDDKTVDLKNLKIKDILPDDLKNKSYAKDMNEKGIDHLFHQFDEAQKLIGKKTLPSDNSSDEEWNNFFGKLRPENPTKYELDVKMSEDNNLSDDLVASLKDGFHGAGLHQKQAKIVLDKMKEGLKIEHENKSKQSQETLGDKLSSMFGGDVNKALQRGKKIMGKYIPEQMLTDVNKLNPSGMALLLGVLNKVHEKHLASDDVKTGNTTNKSENLNTIQGIDAKIAKIRSSNEYMRGRGDKYEEADQQLDELYQKRIDLGG